MSTSAALLLERVRAATADEYTIESELGRGGMAAVFLARDIALERRVAIKVMLPDLVDVEGIQDRFVIEAKTAAHLDHPGIVTVYSVKQRAGLLFIVMKYIEGRTLEGLLKSVGRLNPFVAMSIVRQVAEALQFAHSEGVVHRDVKPSNIIIDTRGRPVVTDFGIAKVMASRSITVTGSMLGTPTYMSPEQCRGLPATAASDQYSLGVMAYEMLAGKVPFSGTIYELINAHCMEPPPPLTEFRLDASIEEIVLKMLAKSPPERLESLSEVARRLSNAMPANSRSDEMQAIVAGFVRGDAKTQIGRAAATIDVAGQATELATTPAKTTPAPGLVVTPDQPSIEIGQSLELRVSQASGASLVGLITWRSEDPTIATVDAKGVVRGVSPGLAKITAQSGAAIGRVAVSVKMQTADSIAVTPQNPEIIAGAEIQYVATVLDARGGTLGGQAIIWQSSDTGICAISSRGIAIGVKPGTATITAICGEVRGTAQARVKLPAVESVVVDPGTMNIEAEESRKVAANVIGGGGQKLAGRTVTWHSKVPTVATVDAQGNVKGITPGTATIVATCEGKDGIASITVRPQPVVAVRIQPEHLQLEVGRSLQLKGIGEDRRGRSVGEKIEWHSDNEQIVLVDASGKVVAVHEGKTVVRAMAGDATSSIAVTIVPRAAASIRIDAHKPTLEVGEFVSFDAVVLDADGGTLPERVVSWTSTDPAIASVDRNGNCEAKKPGAVRITASCENARASTKLSIAAVKAAVVEPPPPPPVRQPSREAETQKMERVVLPPKAPPPPPPAQPKTSPPPSTQTPAPPGEPRKKSKAMPIAIGIVLVSAIGIWAATKGGSKPTTPADVTPPAETKVAVTPPPDTQNKTVSTPPVTPPPETKVADPPVTKTQTPSTQTARGNTSKQGATTNPPPANTPPSRGTSTQTGRDSGTTSRGNANPPPTTTTNPPANPPATTNNPPVAANNPPVTPPVNSNPPAASNPPASNPAADANALCTNAALPTGALNAALAGNPADAVQKLYVQRDANDGKQRDALVKEIKNINKVKASVKTARAESAAGGCDWVTVVEFSGTTAFGGNTSRSWQIKMQLDGTAAAPHVNHIYGASKQ